MKGGAFFSGIARTTETPTSRSGRRMYCTAAGSYAKGAGQVSLSCAGGPQNDDIVCFPGVGAGGQAQDLLPVQLLFRMVLNALDTCGRVSVTSITEEASRRLLFRALHSTSTSMAKRSSKATGRNCTSSSWAEKVSAMTLRRISCNFRTVSLLSMVFPPSCSSWRPW